MQIVSRPTMQAINLVALNPCHPLPPLAHPETHPQCRARTAAQRRGLTAMPPKFSRGGRSGGGHGAPLGPHAAAHMPNDAISSLKNEIVAFEAFLERRAAAREPGTALLSNQVALPVLRAAVRFLQCYLLTVDIWWLWLL